MSVRQLPDPLRTGKALLKQITRTWVPDMPFAAGNAIQPLGDILQLPRVVELLRDSLRRTRCRDVIPREFATYATAGLVEAGDRGAARTVFARSVA